MVWKWIWNKMLGFYFFNLTNLLASNLCWMLLKRILNIFTSSVTSKLFRICWIAQQVDWQWTTLKLSFKDNALYILLFLEAYLQCNLGKRRSIGMSMWQRRTICESSHVQMMFYIRIWLSYLNNISRFNQ